MGIVVVSLLGGLLIAALVLMGIALMIRTMRSSGQKRLAERFPNGPPLLSAPSANCFGLQSRGHLQMRGNGALALSQTELWFQGFLSGFSLCVPLPQIRGIELVDSHLSKRVFGRKLLKIHFLGTEGTEDSVAFLVEDPGRWQRELERLRFG